MENHKDVEFSEKYRPKESDSPVQFFEKALSFTKENYADVIERIQKTEIDTVTKEFFFREYIWSVHTSGFSAKAVSKFFSKLEAAYGNPDELASERYEDAVERVSKVCRNPAKIRSVMRTAALMTDWENFKKKYLSSIDAIEKLPYIGPTTKYHVGRNIGFKDSVKPDLHLERLRKFWGFESSEMMCKHMKEKSASELPLGIVDLCVWYLSSSYGTTEFEAK